MSRDEVRLEIERRDASNGAPHWQTFSVKLAQVVTVADALDAVNREPRTLDGELVAPIAWSASCSFPVCGSCSLSVNGRAALACATPVREVMGKTQRIRLAPLEGFEVLRDLWVDMASMRERAARMQAWIDPALEVVDLDAEDPFERCSECGLCVAACPEAGAQRSFVGPAALAAAHRARRQQPASAATSVARLLAAGGIDDCGRVENCVEICPEAIPLDEALGASAREARRLWLARLLARFKRP